MEQDSCLIFFILIFRGGLVFRGALLGKKDCGYLFLRVCYDIWMGDFFYLKNSQHFGLKKTCLLDILHTYIHTYNREI